MEAIPKKYHMSISVSGNIEIYTSWWINCNDNCVQKYLSFIWTQNEFQKFELNIFQFEVFLHFKCIQFIYKWQRISIVIMVKLKTLVCDLIVIVILKNLVFCDWSSNCAIIRLLKFNFQPIRRHFIKSRICKQSLIYWIKVKKWKI